MNPGPVGGATRTLYTPTFWLACGMHFTGAMGHGMFLLFPLFVRFLGGDDLLTGLVLGTGLGVSVAVRPAVGGLLDRVGRRRVLVWSGLLNAASFLVFVVLRTTGPWLFVLATMNLVVGGALFAGYFTYLADLVPPERRVEGIAVFGIAGMAPNGIGPALGEIMIARTGYEGLFLAAAAFAAVSVVLTLALPEEARPAERRGGTVRLRDIGALVRRGGLFTVMLATFLFGAGMNAAFFFVAPFTRDLGIARAAPFFVAYASTTVVLRLFGRRLPDRVGPERIAVPAFAVFALGLGALTLLPAPGVLVLAGMACGAGHGTLFPVLNGLAVTRTPARFHGTIVSLYTAALDGGAVLGTPVCGAVAELAGYRTMFGLMAVASGAGLVLMAMEPRRVAAAVAVLVLLAAAPTRAARWPALESGPLQDDSFLIEEAYNQEPGVVQHIVNALYDRRSGDWLTTFTQEWPVPDQTHQLSFTVPYMFAGEPGEASGPGDVFLNYRYQALTEKGARPAFAPRLSLVLPTGSARDELGSGSAGVQLGLPFSKQLGPHLSAHVNGGMTLMPHALLPRGASTELTSGSGGGSLIWDPWDAVNLLCEFLASHDERVENGRVRARTRAVINPGIRLGWNGPAGIQWVWGVALPIGLTHDTDQFGVFLYFSVEHAVTRSAREKRQW